MNMPFYEHIFLSLMALEKRYSFQGIVVAAIISVILPLVFSSIFLRKTVRQRGVRVNPDDETCVIMRNSRFSSLVEAPWDGATTMAALFEQSCRRYAHDRLLGTRKVIAREFAEAACGKKFEKLHLGAYEWHTFAETFDRACNFGSGLAKLGHASDRPVAIFADTRAEWFIGFQVILNSIYEIF